MNLRDIIRLEKKVESYGSWLSGDIDRGAWPLKKKKLKCSSDWQWRVVKLSADSYKLRVLLRLNPLLEQFYAILGELREDSIAVLCSHDLHTSHANWHCHAAKGDVRNVFAGVWRDKATFRYWPSYTGDCTTVFDVTPHSAMEIASRLYRFAPPAQREMPV